jgi:quinol monooxygenase YgiN
MPIQSNASSMRRPLFRLCAALILAGLGLGGWALAQEPAAHERIYVVAYVDVLPPDTAAGAKLLKEYAADSRKDKGAVRIEVYAQISRVNHMSIVEVWESQQAFEAHEAAAHTRQFREQLQPLLGSPYDERLHHNLE